MDFMEVGGARVLVLYCVCIMNFMCVNHLLFMQELVVCNNPMHSMLCVLLELYIVD